MITHNGQTYKVVACIPAGRKKYLSIFKHFLYRKLDDGILDAIQLWQNTVDQSDIDYLASMEAENPKVKRYFLEKQIVPSWDTYDSLRTCEFFKNCFDDDTIYIRFDDDIVWAHEDAIEKMVIARIEHPDAFIIYPNIINSTTCTAMHQEKGVLSDKFGKVKQLKDNPGDPNYAYLDNFSYSDSKFIDHIHNTFRKNYEAGTLSEYFVPSREFSNYERFSICSIAWWGKDKIVPGRVEEPQLSWEMPDYHKRPVWFCGDALMVHYAYHTQRPYLQSQGDIPLHFYKSITKRSKMKQHPIMQHNEALEECARAHYEAVVEKDEYGIKQLAEQDKDIKYIVDIGANIGAASHLFHKTWPKAKIIVVEPEPNCMKYARLNTDDALIYEEVAVIDDPKKKKVTFNVCKWAGNGHVDGHFRWDLFAPMGSVKDYEIKVPATTLSALMKKHKFPRIDLLKIDCEGFEGGILLSFKDQMDKVKHFRGEWHGDDDIPRIEEALKETHVVSFDRGYKSHGDIVATRKDLASKETTITDPQGKFRILANGKKQWIL